VHIVDDNGNECGPRQQGLVYFSGGPPFEYHNDPVKTREAYNSRGWGTYGDIGYLDEDGYLYLTDRVANTIISGGVNIYPQEAENVLLRHPAVKDVAVVGVPNEEFGEEVKAVVELWQPGQESAALAADIIAMCRAELSTVKCPRSVDFVAALPRTATGKLLKRQVKAGYWPPPASGAGC
jgi:long-chain acyl-CoA synthetase